MSKARVVLVDDDDGSRAAMATGLRRVGYEVADFDAGEPALAALERGEQADVVITDVRMPGMDGYEVVRRARALRPEIAILMVTAFGDVDGAVQALQGGADDFLTKPVELPVLRKRVEQQLERRNLTRDKRELQERLESFVGFENIIGRSPAMQQVLERVRVVAPAPTTVLIVGESGSGKELIANAIHEHSPRAARRFVALNCGAIPGEILEAELFGHERGAFTGAHQRRVGKLEAADGGTFFLDEISELSADLQVKLLRVLEERRIVRVGGNDEIPVDFRLVAATNRDLDGEVASGRFRQELYYRLKVVTLSLPPLRARGEDVPLLVAHFLRLAAEEKKLGPCTIAPEALERLVQHTWAGNVRELENLIERCVVLRGQGEIGVADLPLELQGGGPERQLREGEAPRPSQAGLAFHEVVDRFEADLIMRALQQTHWNKNQAARLLGLNRTTLLEKIKKKGLAPDQ